jgi:diguanylate cyclase (GGDEF)-like protein
LVDAVLSETGELREMALTLLTEQSSLKDPGLVDSADQAPSGHSTVAVTLRGQMFGVLHAHAQPAQLNAWAGWLSRWLAMEKQLRHYHELAMRDDLTGVWNRRYFHQFLSRVLPRAQRDRNQVTLLIFDIDDFKHYNDTYGHPAGDDILLNIGQLMQSLVRDHDVVARIGGDEFAVIFWEAEGPREPNSRHPQQALDVAHRFQQAVCEHRFPRLLNEAAGTLTISGGLASFPWDGRTTDDLLEYADANALASKEQGKNVITFGPGASRNRPSRE